MRASLDNAVVQAGAKCKAHGPGTTAQVAVADGPAALLQEAGAAAAVMAELRTHLAQRAAPLLAADAGARATASDIARQTGTFVEASLGATLTAAVGHSATALERLLAAEQAKADFAPKLVMGLGGAAPTEGQLSADRPTVACYRCVSLLALVRKAAVDAGLDDRNVAALCAALGDRAVSVLDTHFAGFKFTPAGGLRLKRDVTEYAALLTGWGMHPTSAALTRLAEIGALANLLVAPLTALPGLVNGEGLGVAVRREDALAFLSRRSDYSKSKTPFAQLM